MLFLIVLQLCFSQSIIANNNSETEDKNKEETYFQIDEGTIYGLTESGKKNILKDKSVIIPEGINKIDKNVFQNLNLKTVILNKDLKIIDDYAFANNEIEEIIFPASLEYIGEYAFKNNLITQINIDQVKDVKENAFDNNPLEILGGGRL